jgi:hypothetical protein
MGRRRAAAWAVEVDMVDADGRAHRLRRKSAAVDAAALLHPRARYPSG